MAYELDHKDRKLLCLLDQDARRPLKELARGLRISKQAARQRILKLREAGVISSYYAIINTMATGRIWARVWLKLQMTSPQIEKEIIAFASRQPNAAWVISLTGAYDLLVIYWPRSITEFREMIDDFLFKFSAYVKEHDMSIIVRGHDFSYRMLWPDVESREALIQDVGGIRLDDKDHRILKVLSEHADWSAHEIGQACGIDPKTVYYRIRRLEADDVILAYRIMIDYQKIGHAWYKFFLNFSKMDKKRITGLVSYLRGIPELVYITEPVGPADFEFEVVVPSSDRMQEILTDLRAEFADIIKDYKYIELRHVGLLRYYSQ